jgi:hypothetical protein
MTGPIAQLVEHMAGSHEVRGSNPLGSTFLALFELGRDEMRANRSETSVRSIFRPLMCTVSSAVSLNRRGTHGRALRYAAWQF